MQCKLEGNGPVGRVPESGAIFMANRETKKECLKMEVFALPSGFANFVKQVKAGMFLFLFEFERRQLFGVYRATTDGGINILSKASSSSLKQFPAQVRITPVWSCHPLSEKEFHDVIKENYYSHKKFYMGLSEDQVHKLLQLFRSRKLKNELQSKQPSGDSKPFHDLRHKLSKKFDAEKLEGRNRSPDLLIRDQLHFADQCKEHDNAYRYSVNVTSNRHGTDTYEQCALPNRFNSSLSTKRRMEDDVRYLTDLKDQRSVHHDVSALNFGGGYCGYSLDSNKRRKEDDDRYLMSLKDQRSVYQDVPARGVTLGKGRSSDYDDLILSGKVPYEDKESTLAVGKYIPVSSDLRVSGNDMYTFVDRVVPDSEYNGHPSSKSPHISRETFSFVAKVLSDDKSFMNLGTESTYKLCDSHQDAAVLKPDFHYPLNDTKSSTQGMQNRDLHRPDVYRNSPIVVELRSGDNRPYKSIRLESEHSLGAFPGSGYSAGKFGKNTYDDQGVTGDDLYPVRYRKLKASHAGEPIWSSELHGNPGQSYMSNRRSFGGIQFHKVEGEPAMDSFLNSVTSFGYDKSCQPIEDPLIYSDGPPPRKQNQLVESQHLVHTYPSYHESVITKSLPCDFDLNFSHPDPSSSVRVCSSSSLLRGIPPCHDSGEPYVGNITSLLYHPEENHSRKFCYIDSENKSELQYSSTPANQDYYLGNSNNCFQNTEVAVNRKLENTMPTNRRHLVSATSPSVDNPNTCLSEDVVCREEKVRPHALSPCKHSSFNCFDSGHQSSSRLYEHDRDKSSAGQFPNVNWSTSSLYPGRKDLRNHDSEPNTSQGQAMGMDNDNGEHPLDVSGIPKSNRRSVFARLSSGPDISSREKLDAEKLFGADSTVDEVTDMLLQLKKSQLEEQGKCQVLAKHDEEKLDTYKMLKADASVDEVMGMLSRGKKSSVKKRKLAGQPEEEVSRFEDNFSVERSVEHGHVMMDSVEQVYSKISSAKLVNDVNQADGEDPDGPLRETRLVEFKRRSEMKKNMDGSIIEGSDKSVDKKTNVEGKTANRAVENRTAGESTIDKSCKRRKLVRPVFAENKTC